MTPIYDKTHPHNAVYCAHFQSFIDGEPNTVQVYDPVGLFWFNCEAPGWILENKYRIAPKLIKRFGVMLPAPLVQVDNGQQVWVVGIGWSRPGLCTFGANWEANFEQGYIFATQQDAQATHDVVCARVQR